MFTLFLHLCVLALLPSAFVVFVFMTGLFILAMIKRRNDIADIGWGIGFIMIAAFNWYIGGRGNVAASIVNALVLIWGLRLATHIERRNKGKQEDFRYRQWREEWGRWFAVRTYLQVFLLQGILMFLIALPIIFVNRLYVPHLMILVPIGAVVWIVGFVFESVGDRQLARFIADPNNKGTLLTTGLWRYTRHPNYFGEVTQWWGIFIIACSGLYGWVTIIGPLTITILILKVSGVPLLERSMEKNPAFADYRRRTSKFIPLPPRKGN